MSASASRAAGRSSRRAPLPLHRRLRAPCFWAVENDLLAWYSRSPSRSCGSCTCALAPAGERTPRVFLLVVALPLFFVFTLRVAFPDLSFDVLNHRLIQSERALRGEQLLPGDFFPTIFPFNPAPDMLTGLFRHALGYRLGTVVNLLALLWAGTVLEKILRPYVEGAAWRSAGVLLALFTEHALFQINGYMVDLLALPLLLEATRLALDYESRRQRPRLTLLGAAARRCVGAQADERGGCVARPHSLRDSHPLAAAPCADGVARLAPGVSVFHTAAAARHLHLLRDGEPRLPSLQQLHTLAAVAGHDALRRPLGAARFVETLLWPALSA